MTDDDLENIDLQIEDDAADPVVIAEPDAAKPAAPEPDGVEQLRASLEAAKANQAKAEEAHRAAEERASRYEREASENRGQVKTGQIHQLTNAIELVQTKQVATKRDLSQAMAQGDYDKVADLQSELAEQASNLTWLRQGKDNLERQPRQQQQQVAQPQRIDPVETLARQVAANGSPRSADWIRAHPEVASDPAMHNEMLAAHHRALKASLVPDTDAYFKFVEDRMGMGNAGKTDEPLSPAAAPARRAPIAAAPVSRDLPASNGAKIQLKLTAKQLEAGYAMGLTKDEIIAGAAKVVREGGKLQ